jgi:hypothetical protein
MLFKTLINALHCAVQRCVKLAWDWNFALAVFATHPMSIYWPILSFQFYPQQPEKQHHQCCSNAVQYCAILCNAVQIRLGLELCIGSLCYQPQEHLLAEFKLPIQSTTAREATASMLFNAVQRCAILCNAVQRYTNSPGTGTLHWQSLLPSPRASTGRV